MGAKNTTASRNSGTPNGVPLHSAPVNDHNRNPTTTAPTRLAQAVSVLSGSSFTCDLYMPHLEVHSQTIVWVTRRSYRLAASGRILPVAVLGRFGLKADFSEPHRPSPDAGSSGPRITRRNRKAARATLELWPQRYTRARSLGLCLESSVEMPFALQPSRATFPFDFHARCSIGSKIPSVLAWSGASSPIESIR